MQLTHFLPLLVTQLLKKFPICLKSNGFRVTSCVDFSSASCIIHAADLFTSQLKFCLWYSFIMLLRCNFSHNPLHCSAKYFPEHFVLTGHLAPAFDPFYYVNLKSEIILPCLSFRFQHRIYVDQIFCVNGNKYSTSSAYKFAKDIILTCRSETNETFYIFKLFTTLII
jgi:hypothetical protein